MKLFSDPTGPLIYYSGDTFGVEDLNPEAKMRWRMSRWEIFKLGCKCIWSSIAS